MDYALELENVTRRFGPSIAVDDFPLPVESGVFLGLLDRNGPGKTTTINMCTGLLKPSSGSIRILNMDVQAHYQSAWNRMRRESGVGGGRVVTNRWAEMPNRLPPGRLVSIR